jgi:hypothetical protein
MGLERRDGLEGRERLEREGHRPSLPFPPFLPLLPDPSSDYCSVAVIFRFGTWPTAIRVTSFSVFTSTALTRFDPAHAT